MKNEIHKLLESFGENSRIGDVLEKIGFNWAKKAVDEHLHNTVWILEKAQNDLMKLWNPCGFAKSLQEIYAEAEWEGEQQPNGQPKHVVGSRIVLVPKQPAIRKLFQLLLQLNLAE